MFGSLVSVSLTASYIWCGACATGWTVWGLNAVRQGINLFSERPNVQNGSEFNPASY